MSNNLHSKKIHLILKIEFPYASFLKADIVNWYFEM